MKSADVDARMRVYETAHDHCALPGLFLVARLDGRGFTRLTKELLPLEAPFDSRFRDVMVEVTRHLLDCGLHCVLGYTQSDEISLLLHPDDASFGRKLRKLVSVLAGEASGVASLRLQTPVAFDCRISQLPTRALVLDYFRWRQEDAGRNALAAHCYWSLRKEGLAPAEADARLAGLSTAAKNELLFQRGTNFDSLPNWQKRCVVVHWRTVAITGVDPRTGDMVPAARREPLVDAELPMRDAFAAYVDALLVESGA